MNAPTTCYLQDWTFSPGNVVRIVGGGPAMTVDTIERSGLVLCKWFVGSTLHSHLFRPDVLEFQTH
jgi:uncharacterized protein YodC (DUF2158 family)